MFARAGSLVHLRNEMTYKELFIFTLPIFCIKAKYHKSIWVWINLQPGRQASRLETWRLLSQEGDSQANTMNQKLGPVETGGTHGLKMDGAKPQGHPRVHRLNWWDFIQHFRRVGHLLASKFTKGLVYSFFNKSPGLILQLCAPRCGVQSESI